MKQKNILFSIAVSFILFLNAIHSYIHARNTETTPSSEKVDIHYLSLEKANNYRKKGEYKKAIEILVKSEKSDGSSSVVSERIGRIYNALARESLKKKAYLEASDFSSKASKRLEGALALNPGDEIQQSIMLQKYFNSAINYQIATQSNKKDEKIAKSELLASREACLRKSMKLLNTEAAPEKKYYGRILHEAGFLLTDRPEGREPSLKSLTRALEYFKKAKTVRTGSDRAMTSSRIIKVAGKLGQFDLALSEAIETGEFYLKKKDVERIGFIIEDLKQLLDIAAQNKTGDKNKMAKTKNLLKKLLDEASK